MNCNFEAVFQCVAQAGFAIVFAALLIGRWGCFSMQGTYTERETYLFWTVSVVKMLILMLSS